MSNANPKYEILQDQSITYSWARDENETLYRIRALRDFGDVKAGDLGGFIEREANLSHDGNCWVYHEAKVWGEATVSGDARVTDHAKVDCWARVEGEARVRDHAIVSGKAWIDGKAVVRDHAKVFDDARVTDNACVYGMAWAGGYTRIAADTQWDYCASDMTPPPATDDRVASAEGTAATGV